MNEQVALKYSQIFGSALEKALTNGIAEGYERFIQRRNELDRNDIVLRKARQARFIALRIAELKAEFAFCTKELEIIAGIKWEADPEYDAKMAKAGVVVAFQQMQGMIRKILFEKDLLEQGIFTGHVPRNFE